MGLFGLKIQSPFVSDKLPDLATKGIIDRNSIEISPTFDEAGNPFYPFGNGRNGFNYRNGNVLLTNNSDLSGIYHSNPIINAALNINANYLANVEVRVKDLSTGIIYSKQDVNRKKINNKIVEKMFSLISEPNPLQSTDEFLKFLSITHDTYGNSMIRGNFQLGRIDIETISTMFCLWPQFAKPIMTKKYWNAVDIKGIIDHWEYEMLNAKDNFSTDEVLHRKEVNISVNEIEDLVLGKSKLIALSKVISTIDASYDARETIANERGANVFLSPDKKDPFMGSMDLTQKDRKTLELILQKQYGFKHNQTRTRVLDTPVKITQLDQDVRKLGIIEEIGLDTMITAHVFKIPPGLIKMFREGATYENMSADERIMYQSNSMPLAISIFNDLSNWLGVRKKGFEYVTSWGHIAVLAENEKERSLIDRNESFVCREAFLAGMITYNQWLKRLNWEEIKEDWAKKRITEMTDREIQIISGRNLMQAQNANPEIPNSSSQL